MTRGRALRRDDELEPELFCSSLHMAHVVPLEEFRAAALNAARLATRPWFEQKGR